MTRTTIAGALVVALLTSCSVEEAKQSPRVLRASLASQAAGKADASQTTAVTAAQTTAFESAGLRADFQAP